MTLSFTDTRSRRSDPSTSRDAAQHAATAKAQAERIAIRECLAQHGELTPPEIAAKTGIPYHEVHRRIGETAGVERTGEKRAVLGYRCQSVWRAA